MINSLHKSCIALGSAPESIDVNFSWDNSRLIWISFYGEIKIYYIVEVFNGQFVAAGQISKLLSMYGKYIRMPGFGFRWNYNFWLFLTMNNADVRL